MSDSKYVSLPLHENDESGVRCHQHDSTVVAQDAKNVLLLIVFAVVWFLVGLGVGRGETSGQLTETSKAAENGLLPPQSFIPESTGMLYFPIHT